MGLVLQTPASYLQNGSYISQHICMYTSLPRHLLNMINYILEEAQENAKN